MPPPHKFDIALSFAGEDRAYVQMVADGLIAKGIKVFYDTFEQADLWGKDLYDHLVKVYNDSARFTVIFISKHYRDKVWTIHERRAAKARALAECHEYILPARFDDTEIEGLLPTVDYIDLRNLSPRDVCVLLCQKLEREPLQTKAHELPSPWAPSMGGKVTYNYLSNGQHAKKWPESEVRAPLTIVTLWRAKWGAAQDAVLAWLLAEEFPVGSHFIWTVQEDSPAAACLEAGLASLNAHRGRHTTELITTGPQAPTTREEKHLLVADLYSDALNELGSPLTLLVEDDVVGPAGATGRLLDCLSGLPAETAAVMAAYRSRAKPDCTCASDLQGRYIPWENLPGPSAMDPLLPCRWIGGGLTLYRSPDLRACLPMEVDCSRGWIRGWDVTLCGKLVGAGKKLFLHGGVRAGHMCPEVLGRFPDPAASTIPAEVPLPPPQKRWCGREFKDDSYYRTSSLAEAQRLIEKCDATPDSRVLDIGCGYGRLASGLIISLPELNYEGLDVDAASIRWCQDHLTSRAGTFHFQRLDVRNDRYNRTGQPLDALFRFPFQDGEFDVIYLYSVFSHMAEQDVRVYLREMKRLLAGTGRGFLTAFVEEGVGAVEENPPDLPFRCSGPLHVVRYERGHFFQMITDTGLAALECSGPVETDGQRGIYLGHAAAGSPVAGNQKIIGAKSTLLPFSGFER